MLLVLEALPLRGVSPAPRMSSRGLVLSRRCRAVLPWLLLVLVLVALLLLAQEESCELRSSVLAAESRAAAAQQRFTGCQRTLPEGNLELDFDELALDAVGAGGSCDGFEPKVQGNTTLEAVGAGGSFA